MNKKRNMTPHHKMGRIASARRFLWGKEEEDNEDVVQNENFNEANVPGVPDDDDIFDRPGDVRSVPRDGQPRDVNFPDSIWDRNHGSKVPGVFEGDGVSD
jgi:hypothetical protein